jgi:probable rRNA maturation factor
MRFNIEVANEQQTQAIDEQRLKLGAQRVLEQSAIAAADISIAVVDDSRMHDLNRQYLEHDYPTDVLSFVLEFDADEQSLDGEVIVSADYAAREAARYGWTVNDELLLYVLHGCLHLVGHDDMTPAAKQAMREAEARLLGDFGLVHRYDG